MSTVVVLGATGEMGSRVCRLLRRFTPSALLVGANRSGTGHTDFAVRRADVTDGASLRELLRDADLVINAVGPYRYDPAPLAEACIATRCHYADLAEDLDYLAALEREVRARGAAAAGVAFVAGCSTVPGLVQVLASGWRARSDVARVGAWLSMGSANPVSAGLLVGLLTPLGRRAPDGSRWFARSESGATSDGRRLRFGSYPAPFPARGMRLGARRVAVHLHVGFDRAWITRSLVLLAHVLGRMPAGVVARVAPILLPFVRLARPLGTPRGVLAVVAEDARGRELTRVEVHARAAGLDVPALPAVFVARRLLEPGGFAGAGLLGLDRVVPFERAVAWLGEAGYEVRLPEP